MSVLCLIHRYTDPGMAVQRLGHLKVVWISDYINGLARSEHMEGKRRCHLQPSEVQPEPLCPIAFCIRIR